VNQDTIDEIKKFRKTNIKVPKTDKITLDIDEIYSLYDFEFEENDKKYEKINPKSSDPLSPRKVLLAKFKNKKKIRKIISTKKNILLLFV
jgi:hypothetical protein